MIKIASETARDVVGQFGPALRAQQEEIRRLREKNASLEREKRVTKIASDMNAKGIWPEATIEEKVSRLSEASNLDAIEEAVGMGALQVKVAEVADRGTEGAADANARFTNFIMSNDDQ